MRGMVTAIPSSELLSTSPAPAVTSRIHLLRFVLLLLCVLFPLITWGSKMDGNSVKYLALMVATLVIAGVMIGRQFRDPHIAEHASRSKVALLIVAICSVYGFVLCGFALETVLIALLAPLLVMELQREFQIDRPRSGRLILWSVTGFVAMAMVSSYFSHHQYAAILGDPFRHTGVATLLACLLIFLTAARLRAQRNDLVSMLFTGLLASSGVIALLALVQFLAPADTLYRYFPSLRGDPRPIGTLGQANWFGTYLLFVMPLAVHRMMTDTRRIWMVLVGLLHASLLICQTRGAWVAEAAMLGYLCWHFRSDRPKLIRLAGVVATATILVLPLKDGTILARASSLGREAELVTNGSSSAGTGRFGFWKYALRHLPDHLLLGAGLDSFTAMADEGEHVPISKAHSIYLDHALSTGLPGLACYLAMLWLCFWKHAPAEMRWATRALLVAYLAQGIFIHDTIQTWPLMWLLAGLLAGAHFAQPTATDSAAGAPDAAPAG